MKYRYLFINSSTRTFIITFVLCFTSQLWSSEIYSNEEIGFQISFPHYFEVEESADDISKTVSVTCTHAGMIFIINAIVFKQEFTDEQRLEQEAASTVNICEAMGAKWKLRKITTWKIGEESGFICPIKGKQKSGEKKVSFYGNFYVIMVNKTQYQLTILAPKRKNFDGALERAFSTSLRLLL